jgi:hypothetical protein
MRNIREDQIRTAIIMSSEEYEQTVSEALGKEIAVHFEMDGLWYETKTEDEVEDEDIKKGLSEYFDVQVTSIHIDDCEESGVWICFIEEAVEKE